MRVCNRLQFTESRTPHRMFDNIGHGLESSRTAGWCSQGAAVEADTIREQQLKQTQSGSSSSAQRAVQHQITHIGNDGEGEQARRAKLLVSHYCIPLFCHGQYTKHRVGVPQRYEYTLNTQLVNDPRGTKYLVHVPQRYEYTNHAAWVPQRYEYTLRKYAAHDPCRDGHVPQRH